MKEKIAKKNVTNNRMKKYLIGCTLMVMIICFLPCNAKASSKSGTAKVWAGVPLVGSVSVCTPYTVYYTGTGSNRNVTSVKTGKSYLGWGVSVFNYEHMSSWGERTGWRYFNVYSKGRGVASIGFVNSYIGPFTFSYSGSLD